MTLRSAPLLLALFLALFLALPLASQELPGWGRLALFGQFGSTRTPDGGASRSFSDLSASLTLRSATGGDAAGFEYAIDGRGSSIASGERTNRLFLYDAWVGGRLSAHVSARVGQMWLNDLGALGSLGGTLAEVHLGGGVMGRARLGIFGGMEPQAFDAGYVPGVRKYGGYLALDGADARRHVLGYVTLRNQGLVERSVLTTTHFVPVGRDFFLYAAGEYDLSGPGGAAGGRGLNYAFANARFSPVKSVELSATWHHGRSIDTRTITQDQLDGRPVSTAALQGLLFESAGGRLSVEVVRNLRLSVGYSRDRNNSGDAATGRLSAGLWAANVLGSGFDVTVNANRYQQPGGTDYDGWWLSLGRTIGTRAYLSADYSTALSTLRVAGDGGVLVETRPRTRRVALSGNVNLSRVFSLLLTAERLLDDASTQDRGMLGLSVRF